jgi:predicted ATPase
MLKRLYANNYRCLVNFEINFDGLTLLMGPNGGGKSTLFELLFSIRRLLIDNARIGDVFPPDDMTAWVDKIKINRQTFELDVQGYDGLFRYKLVVSHNLGEQKQRIENEELFYDNKPLFEFKQGEVKLYHDDHIAGPKYTFDWTMSALATIVTGRPDNKKLTWFKEWIRTLFIVSLQPKTMTSDSLEESAWLDRKGGNFASWYRYLSQEHQDKMFNLTELLRKTIPGFYAFKLEQAGKSRELQVAFINDDDSSSPIYFDFEQLSDGQRVMIVLYSLLVGLENQEYTLFLDEPENYVALFEIQPWLIKLQNSCGEGIRQAVIISHHPELIDFLGPESGKWIEREPLGPTRVKELQSDNTSGMRLSEQIARGWNK